jgi:hypothetical protein
VDIFFHHRSAVLIKEFPVDKNLRLHHITQHVPMESRDVFTTRFGEAEAQGEMDRAPDFFIEEHVFGKLLDPIVRANTHSPR